MANLTKGARAQHKHKEICPHCKKPFSVVGLKNHIAAKHGATSPTPIPVDVSPEIAQAIAAIDRKISELQAARESLLRAFPAEAAPKKPVRAAA